MVNLGKVAANKIFKAKMDQSYNKKFLKARANLEIYKQDNLFSTPTKEMLEMNIK